MIKVIDTRLTNRKASARGMEDLLRAAQETDFGAGLALGLDLGLGSGVGIGIGSGMALPDVGDYFSVPPGF